MLLDITSTARGFYPYSEHAIFYHLSQLEPSFMAQAEWIEKPWHKFAKQPIDRIIDCIAHIPRLLHQLQLFENLSPEDQRFLGLSLMAEFRSLDTTLQSIYSMLNDSVEGPLYWSALSRHYEPAEEPLKGPLFPIAFHFPNVKTAGHLMMYWATCALLWTGWHETYQKLEQLNENLPPGLPSCDVLPMITNVCQSAEFCLDETNQLIGVFIASTPLAICKAILSNKARHQQHFAWIQATLERLQTRGIRILRYH
ncbi:hypothetical protein N7510_000041 [Penicillium lagena]|uniref:uncharacterized protein n=1 Tax=Penicillium lagena TaxID=94218 RepID=UPI002541ADBC|nr:uncharacterized protein N7510_000041 [Penicillium lagena]KAJ5623732.1 hypothetical protein N7510_000041 [Penicillium lagena]